MEAAPHGSPLERVENVGDMNPPPWADSDLLAAIDALPARKKKPGVAWSPAMDAALLAGWPVKRQVDVARVIGVSPDTARKRYEELTR